ncbi:hypothetical protein F5Y10DRAFT_274452 [Nemania abortiva]|nr:hypothetical protein F5Y10DRAFT_274452 [Nemania abortiva]
MARPSTATSTDHYHGHRITDLLEPALDGPPSPEGIRAFSRRMKRGSISEQQLNELVMPSTSSSSRSQTPDTIWERGLENPSLSRNPSQRSSVMRFKERPDSVQLFGKAVFSRKPKLRRGLSDQGHPSSPSLLSLVGVPTDSAPDLPKEQRFIQSMFTRRRTRGASEASLKYQISGPYDFQHVSHSSRETLPEALPGLSRIRPRTATELSNRSVKLNSQTLDKPLPTPPPSQQDSERSSPRDSIQMSPPRLSRFVSNDSQTSPIPPPPRTSSRISVRHDRTDSFNTPTIEKLRINSGYQPQPFILPSIDGPRSAPLPYVSTSHSEPRTVGSDEESPYPLTTIDDAAWPLTASMTSLPEVPEEEEYHLTTIRSRTSVMSNTASLRGSISVPHLRRVSLSQATQRPPSNASDTLGRFDLLAAQRAMRECDEEMDQDYSAQDNWEDDIDYCYDHAAEADCDFAWERLSCDYEREDYYPEGSALSYGAETSFVSFKPTPASLLSADVPGLSPTSYGSGATPRGATTPTSLTTPMTSNFSLPRIDTSTQLKRDHDRSHSSASSFREVQEFCLSPSLLIPNDYHEKMLQYERGELDSHASSDDLKNLPYDDRSLLDKPGAFLHARSSASTTMSTLSEQSVASSRYPSSTFTRWTSSSSSSWQAHADSQPVTITLNDKESIVTPTSSMPVVGSNETPVATVKQETVREGHSRAQSEAGLLMKVAHDVAAPLGAGTAKESLKTHRRARTASRSHTSIPQRP